MVITDEDIAYLSDLAPAFDPAKAYVVPDMIIADGILKMCVVEGVGNAATFVDASLQDVIKAVIAQSQTPESLVAKLVDLAPEYRIGEEYEVDDLVVKEGKLQMCVQAEEGEPPLFQPTTVEAAMAKLRERIADVREIAEDAAGDAQEAKEKSEEALGAAGDAVSVADSASNRVGLVEALIPNEATPDNQLADKDFVNSSIATNTATFIRTFNLISDLHLPLSDKDNYEVVGAGIADYISQYMPRVNPDINDYCFVQIPRTETELETYVRIDRYKYTLDQSDDSSSSPGDGSSSPEDDMGSDPEVGEDPGYVWKFEFSLNNSSFTAEQWAAINSGITSAAVTKLNGLPDATTLGRVLDSKVSTDTKVNGKSLSTNITLYGTDIIKDPETSGPSVKTAIDNAQSKANDAYDLADGKYTKPGTGIPESDLSSDLKTKIAGKTDRSQVCSEWHSQTAYTTTSVVLRDGKFYLCKTAHTSGSVWDGTKWEETTLDKVMERYGKLTPIYSDTPTYSEWDVEPATATINGRTYTLFVFDKESGDDRYWWLSSSSTSGTPMDVEPYDPTATSLAFTLPAGFSPSSVTATRTRTDIIGYTLGEQTDKPLASIDPLLFARYYPEGNVKSATEFRDDIKYNLNDSSHTATVKPFCNTGTAEDDNSNLAGRVVIPPFVDASGNGYISDDGTRYKVVGVSDGSLAYDNTNLTAIVAPNTVTTIGEIAFADCTSLTSVSLPAAQTVGGGAFGICSSLTSVYLPVAVTISKEAFYSCTLLTSISLPSAQTVGESAFSYCTSLTSISLPSAQTIGETAFSYCDALAFISLPAATTIGVGSFNSCTALTIVSLPAATSIGDRAFGGCAALASVSLPSAQTVGESAFNGCTLLTTVDFGATPRSSVPTLNLDAFNGVPTTCKIIVPYTQYDAWKAADVWKDLPQEFVRHAEKADKPATFTTGNLAKFDNDGNPVDSGKSLDDVSQEIQDAIQYAVVVDDKLVPVEGPSSEEVYCLGNATSYLAEHLPAWTVSGDYRQNVILRNRYGASEQFYHYDLSLFTDRIVFWVEGKGNGEHGVFTRSIVFPKSGVYALDIEYAAGYANYPNAMGQARFVVDAGTSGEQDVIGVNDPSIVQHAQVQFAANAGAGSISVKGKTGLSGNACCVVIASAKVTLVKEIGIEIGDIVAPDDNAQTGQAADAKATGDALADKANASDLRYTLPETATTISSASQEVVSGETINYGEMTLADRTQNLVCVIVALDELRVTIPPAVSGKVRDFGLIVAVGMGEGEAITAPALVPVAPTGETIAMMNAEGEMPTLADGTTTASGFTALYFTEVGINTFLVKGEQLKQITQ